MSYGYGGKPNPFDQRGQSGGGGGYGQQQSSYNQPSGGYGRQQSYDSQGGGGYVAGSYNSPPQGSYNSPPQGSYNSPPQGSYNSPPPPRPPVGQFGQRPRPSRSASPAMGRDEYGSNNVEMASLAQNASSFSQEDPNYILNECSRINNRIDELVNNKLAQLRMLMNRSVNEAVQDDTAILMDIDDQSKKMMDEYSGLTLEVRKLKGRKGADRQPGARQVGLTDRKIRDAIQQYRQLESEYRGRSSEKAKRQFLVANPNASPEELDAFMERDPEERGGVFQQAMMSNRTQQGRAVLENVRSRRQQFDKIAQQVEQLAIMFDQLDQIIREQDVQVQTIEQKGEEVVENLDDAQKQIEVAAVTAKKTRKKKWICLGLVVAIVVIIAVIVTIYFLVIKPPQTNTNNNNGKRSLLGDVDLGSAAALARRYVVSGSEAPPVSQPVADFMELARSGATNMGGKFTLESLAAGKERRTFLSGPGGRALNLLTGMVVRGREAQ